ncbi:MAG: DNA/RNA non-specific endonuclease [bacterium]
MTSGTRVFPTRSYRASFPIHALLAVFALLVAGAYGPAGSALAATSAASFCLDACPEGAPAKNKTVVHHVYALSSNPDTKFADWVAYKISKATIGSNCSRKWAKDPDLAAGTTLKPADYKDISAALQSDRGHQAPLASLCGSKFNAEANYLSNITPQKSDLNQGAWVRLETAERKLITGGTAKTVYTVTGTLYEKKMPPLPKASVKHKVPSGYWKIVAVETDDGIDAVAFVMPQDTPKAADYCETRTTIGDVETRSGLKFFLDLNETDRTQLEESEAKTGLYEDLGCE